MAEVVLVANVIVAILYEADSQHRRARELVDRLEGVGDSLVLLDFIVFEALSVLCRRAMIRFTRTTNDGSSARTYPNARATSKQE